MPKKKQKSAAVTYVGICDAPGYRVGDDGSVWSRRRRGPGGLLGSVWRRLRPSVDKDGYEKVILSVGGKRRYCRVHALVLEAFVGPCPAGHESRHRNGVRHDNRRCNLCWSTHADNVADKIVHGTHQCGERNGNARITARTACLIKRLLRAGVLPAAIARRAGVPRCIVYNIKQGAWKHVEV